MHGGTPTTPTEVFALLARNPLLTGVTFSGGEPFLQSIALQPLARMVREAGLELAVYTGFLFEELLGDPDHRALLELADTLIDGPFVLAERDLRLKYKGSRNQRILDVRASLAAGEAVLDVSERWN